MRVETFLDYNEILKVVFETLDDEIKYDLICDYGNERLRGIILENLNGITTFEPTENPNIYKLSISDDIYILINKETGEIENKKRVHF